MKTAVYSSKPYDEEFLNAAAGGTAELSYFEERLNPHTAALAAGHEAICAFVNDILSAKVLDILHRHGVRFIALRCAGFNQVDIRHAASLGLRVARVPAYSPYAVAEFALALMLALNRRIHRAYNRVRDGNFSIDGLLGFDMHGKTIGLVGTGKIGLVMAKILSGFGMRILGHDVHENPEFAATGGRYVDLETLWAESDIISLHCPLTPQTYHIVDKHSIDRMKPGVMIINTSRGALVHAEAVIEGLKSGRIGHLGLDVYEQEADIFYENLSEEIIQDDILQRVITFPNVLITSHQAYFTDTALQNIAETTIANLRAFANGEKLQNEVTTGMMH
ncbi:MAG TPA: 2-hydroxyacid dehydrogenase [Terrimicrobiaceae bacterium]|nr:2-hydroxyacid dehydrogenase [Terrimicrobiaceae bacterium]